MLHVYNLVFICFLQVSLCCHYGYIWDYPYSTSVAVGDSAQFNCYGRGSYLYWYIDGINTEDMSSEEITDRGISFSGYYNYFSPYYYICFSQDSYLTMAGNCLNNNSQIHCVILGDEPPPLGGNTTSNTATLTVEGDPTDINGLQAIQTSANQLLVYWQLLSVSSQNYTQSISIAANGITTYSTILDKLALYHFNTIDTPDPCVEYNITISVETDNITCSDSITISSYLKGLPLQIEDTKQDNENKELIQFKAVNSSSCPGSLPNTVTLVLLDNQGNQLQSSNAIPWDNLTVIGHEEYQMEWSFDLQDNTQYQLMIITHNSIGQTTSDPIVISTFDVTSVQYSMDNTSSSSSELCITCTFNTNTQAKGCLVVLLNTDTTLISGPLRISRNSSNNNTASDCITLSDNGHYILSVYDWEEDGGLSNETAVSTSIRVVGIIPSETKRLTTISSIALSTQHFTSTTVVITSTVSLLDSNNSSAITVLGVLLGMCLLLLLLVLAINGILILKSKLHHTTRSSNTDVDTAVNDAMTEQSKSAYETIKLSEREQEGQYTDVRYEERGTVTNARQDVYEMVSIKPDPRYQVHDNPHYANVTYTD